MFALLLVGKVTDFCPCPDFFRVQERPVNIIYCMFQFQWGKIGIKKKKKGYLHPELEMLFSFFLLNPSWFIYRQKTEEHSISKQLLEMISGNVNLFSTTQKDPLIKERRLQIKKKKKKA